jgi:hypothetical protein
MLGEGLGECGGRGCWHQVPFAFLCTKDHKPSHQNLILSLHQFWKSETVPMLQLGKLRQCFSFSVVAQSCSGARMNSEA